MSNVSIYTDSPLLNRAAKEKRNPLHIAQNRFSPGALRKGVSIDARAHGPQYSHRSPIIAHSHLCWDWVWQRPQQFLSRLSKRHRILFVETRAPDPNLVAPLARLEVLETYPNLTLLHLQFPTARWNDGAYI